MMKQFNNLFNKLACAIVLLAICLTLIAPFSFWGDNSVGFSAFAEEAEKVTVAYIDYNNFFEAKEDGSYFGYGADYLNRIAAYTGWQYEFIDMDWTEAYNAVKAGSVDFYCVARQTEDRQSDFDFSLYPICNEEMKIYTKQDSDIYYQDYQVMNGKTVGMLENSGEIDYLEHYAEENGFSCTIKEYPMNEAAVEALENGQVDMIALVNYSVSGDYKLVGNFGVSPAYMMSCQGSTLMAQFSKAQEKLHFDDPVFTANLENQYYGNEQRAAHLTLTREEVGYINALKDADTVLNVAISVDMAPIEYYDYENKCFKGLTVDLYKRISDLTGLTFNFVRREDKDALIAGMGKGEVTLLGALAQNPVVEKNLSLTQSNAFYENTLSLVTKDMTALNANSVVAIPAGYPQFYETAKENGYTVFTEYPTFEECVKAVDRGNADLTYIISMCEGYLLDHATYADLKTSVCEESAYGICFGAYNEYDSRLISIINKSLSAIPNREVNELIITNTAMAKPKQTFADFIVSNSVALLITAVVMLALITVTVIWLQKNRQRLLLNEKLRQHQNYLQHLYDTLPCGILRYEYAPPHKIIGYNASCAKIYGYEDDFPVVGETPDVTVEAGTEEAFQRKFDECIAANRTISFDWSITRRDGSKAYTNSVMDIVETENGKLFQEVLVDITERKEREIEILNKYNSEIHRSNMRDHDLLYTACFDVTEQVLTETDIDVPGIHGGMSVSAFVEELDFELKGQQSQEAMAEFKSGFTAEHMKSEYERGNFELSFDLCRERDGQIQWLRSDLALRHNPITGHLMCFDYIHDVTDERVSQRIVQLMAFADCEYYTSVYLSTERCLQYKVEADKSTTRTDTKYMVNDILCSLCEEMTATDAEKFREATALTNVTEKLKENTHYQTYATLHGTTESRQDKSISFFYTNKQGGVLAYTIEDVTEIRASEVRHAQLLADALAAAEKADAAKSRFLSGVSHEMRTPLNAIIGFLELAKDASDDVEKAANCIASSDLAAKQLLNVINDVLDMSSIESGKLKIANASFNFRHLITSLTNIYGTQCKQKNVLFESFITTPVEDWLVGDELRVNQILMNLLGNAVKFTEQGRISLSISQMEAEDERVFLRFIVADTGCGMTEELKARLFKPFEQESADTARKYGGSGLGLSIVKNLVGLMEGTITVESQQGKGTSFIVDLPFRKSDVTQSISLPQQVETLHILTVDDEPSEREYMSLVLTRMGVRFKSVCGGDEALAELEKAEKANDLYNVCLIDWRMPGLNGCDATKRIRKKYGKDLIVIVVSAYDFQQTENSATDAGANLFMTKPIFQSTLFDLFMTLTDGNVAKPKDQPQEWDFTGKRVLLAEDNVLNQIVAKGYLTKCNLIIDVAVDGKCALDMFEASAPGYYDAILMDIQMPVMDGYEATRAIRASAHPQANTIQIIALSADAFTEDIAKALSVGMNAHVAKPIKPDVLAKTLHRGFYKSKGALYD